MGSSDLLVIAGAAAGIAWVNWYFFLANRGEAAMATSKQGVQEVDVVVKGGYSPGAVRVRQGVPVRLVFDRQETSGCSEEVVIPELGLRQFLPAFEQTAVEFTPQQAGTLEYTCGMGMLRGRIHVEAGEA